jgi:PBSX family phage terminase large subunit
MKLDLFSPKQLNAIDNSTGFINILEGAVRSGKTMAANIAWIFHLMQSPHEEFLMSGESTDSLYRNVIDDLIGILGQDRAFYYQNRKGGAQLVLKLNETKICYCRGSKNKDAEGSIRGMTIAGWYADEVTLHHETFVKQAINRMSLNGAKAIWTTNPDSPFHYIKKEYIEKANEREYKNFKFRLEDNLTLSDRYKRNLKQAYSGVWHKRFIEGLWVKAEGLIYDMFHDKHINRKKTTGKKIIACDYGTGNPTVFLLIDVDRDKVHVEREYYYSGRDSGVQKTDSQYANDMTDFLNNNGVPRNTEIIVDPSAASFIVELRQRGLNVQKANNAVIDGIRNVSMKLSKNEISVDPECQKTIEEFHTYSWDENAQNKGEDKPLKENDHCMDALRYGVMSRLQKARAVRSIAM